MVERLALLCSDTEPPQDRSWPKAREGLGPCRDVRPGIFGCVRDRRYVVKSISWLIGAAHMLLAMCSSTHAVCAQENHGGSSCANERRTHCTTLRCRICFSLCKFYEHRTVSQNDIRTASKLHLPGPLPQAVKFYARLALMFSSNIKQTKTI